MPWTTSNLSPLRSTKEFVLQSTSGFTIVSNQSRLRMTCMPSIIGTEVKDTLLTIVPMHTNTSGAILVATIVCPLANSSKEYAPTNSIGGRVCNCSLTNDRVAPESTRADTHVSLITALRIRSKWSLSIGPGSVLPIAMGSVGVSFPCVKHLGAPTSSDRNSFAFAGAPIVCSLETLSLSPTRHVWQCHLLSTRRLHFCDLCWRRFCLLLGNIADIVQPLWLGWTRRPGCCPDWPEPGPVSFPTADACGKHPPTWRVAVLPPDPIDRPSSSAAHWWPLQPPGASSDSSLNHLGQTLQTWFPRWKFGPIYGGGRDWPACPCPWLDPCPQFCWFCWWLAEPCCPLFCFPNFHRNFHPLYWPFSSSPADSLQLCLWTLFASSSPLYQLWRTHRRPQGGKSAVLP